jgi:hypothetical protein
MAFCPIKVSRDPIGPASLPNSHKCTGKHTLRHVSTIVWRNYSHTALGLKIEKADYADASAMFDDEKKCNKRRNDKEFGQKF